MDIAGKKAIVFGGTSGIGLAAAKMLVQESATVVAVSRNPSKAGPMPEGISTEACDARDGAAMESLFSKHSGFDILVSAATGGERAFGPFLEMDMDGFKGSFDKLWGYANVVRYGVGHLNEGGSITLVSGSPARKAQPGQTALSAVGGAVEAMVRSVAKEIAPRHRINVVSPGIIDTPMVKVQGAEREALLNKMTQGKLIPRAGTPEEVAQGILFLVKNDFVTGTTVDVDGGALLS